MHTDYKGFHPTKLLKKLFFNNDPCSEKRQSFPRYNMVWDIKIEELHNESLPWFLNAASDDQTSKLYNWKFV